jgi:hypothetical protein
MKKQIISAIVLAGMVIGSTSAFASRARQNVMGTDATGIVGAGAMHYDTMYNIFYNPAYVNDFKNWAIVEKGAATSSNEGGFVSSMMNFNVGVFMNRAGAFAAPANSVVPAYTTLVRPIDLVVGGDQGVKWGFGATYANENGTGVGTPGTNTQTNLTLRAGVSINNFDPFISYRVIGKDKPIGAAPAEVTNKDMTAGLRYRYGEWTPYAAYRTGEAETATATPAVRGKFTGMLLGVGRDAKLGEGARLVYGLAYGRTASKDLAPTPLTKSTATIMPINMALEGDVASWITLRAGMRYDLMNKLSGNTTAALAGAGTQTGTVSARIGATIHANKFDFDWAFGQGTAGTGNIDSDSFGFDGGTFTNASLSYKW